MQPIQIYKMGLLEKISRRQLAADVVKDLPPGSGLKRVLGAGDLVAFGVSSTLGSGIFVSLGVISHFAGPGLFLSFTIAATVCLLSAFCFSEFACRLPVSGQSYTYTYVAMGELWAFLMGWLSFLAYSIATAAVSRGWATHLSSLVFSVTSFRLPAWSVAEPFAYNSYLSLSALAACLNLLCTILACWGVSHSTKVAYILVVINLSLMVGFSLYGALFYGETSNMVPLLPFGFGGVLKGSGLAFFCCTGWELTCTLSEEVKNPNRNIPKGIMGALFIVTLLYCAVCLTLSSMVSIGQISLLAPIAEAFLFHNDTAAAFIVSFTVVIVCVPSTISGIVGTPRIIYKMAQDGLLPASLSRVNRDGSPVNATVLCGIISASLAGFINFESLAASCSAATLFIFAVVCIAIPLVRLNERDRRSPLTCYMLLFALSSFAFTMRVQITEFILDGWNIGLALTNLLSAWICVRTYNSGKKHVLYTPLIDRIIVKGDREDIPYLCPFVPYIPLLAAWVNIFIISSLGLSAVVGLHFLLMAGLLVYFGYGIQHSNIGKA